MWDKRETENVMKQLISEGKIEKPETGRIIFFMAKSQESLNVAQKLQDISQDTKSNLKSYMWIISTSYYSMFFAATALLAQFNKKIITIVGIHKLTFHALAYYFYILDNKLQKQYLEEYKESYDNVEELLQISEKKALELLRSFDFEQGKRKTFTYDMGVYAQENKAITSVKRAKEFYDVVDSMLKKTKSKNI